MPENKKVIVVGAGIGGITAAYKLQKEGYSVSVYDQADFVGGRMKAIERGGFKIDVGAGILPGAYVDTKELITEAGLDTLKEDVKGNCAFMRDGKAHMIDLGNMELGMLTSGIVGIKSKLALSKLVMKLLANKKYLTFHNMGLSAHLDTETVTDYCQRELGQEALDYLMGPFVRTMFLHGPDESSLAELLWCFKNLTGSSFSLTGGMDSLAKELAKDLDVQLNTQVKSLAEFADGVEATLMDSAGSERSETADFAVIATDAKHLQALHGQVLTEAQNAFLSNLGYSRDFVISFALSKPPAIDATLAQVPEDMDDFLAALVIDNKKGSGRVPEGKGMVTCHLLSSWGERFKDKPDEELVADAQARVAKIIPEVGDCLEFANIERWDRAATLHELGSFKQQASFMQDIDRNSRIQYCGDYMALSSVNVSVATAKVAVNNLLNRL